MDNQELELLRQRVLFLEQMLERYVEQIAALETRVAILEQRPVTVAPFTEEMVGEVSERIAERMGSWPARRLAPHGVAEREEQARALLHGMLVTRSWKSDRLREK
jgi:hypothetical protein